jgi:hypothetical protein
MPRLPLNKRERVRSVATLRNYLGDRSSIVKTCALQALAELASRDDSLFPGTMALLQSSLRTGTAAMKARSRKLLRQLETL